MCRSFSYESNLIDEFICKELEMKAKKKKPFFVQYMLIYLWCEVFSFQHFFVSRFFHVLFLKLLLHWCRQTFQAETSPHDSHLFSFLPFPFPYLYFYKHDLKRENWSHEFRLIVSNRHCSSTNNSKRHRCNRLPSQQLPLHTA